MPVRPKKAVHLTEEQVKALDEYIDRFLRDPDTYARVHPKCSICKKTFPDCTGSQVGALLSQYVSLRRDKYMFRIAAATGYEIYSRSKTAVKA